MASNIILIFPILQYIVINQGNNLTN